MATGLLLKLETAEAVVAQENFKKATIEAIRQLDAQDKAVRVLERSLQGLARSSRGAGAGGGAFTGGGGGGGVADVLAPLKTTAAEGKKELDALFRDVEGGGRKFRRFGEDASDSLKKVSGSSAAAESVIKKLLELSGNRGAANAFGLMATAGKALASSVNLVGIASAAAAGFLLSMVSGAGKAADAYAKLNESAKQTQAEFNNTSDAIERVRSGLQGIAGAQARGKPYQGEIEEGKRLAAVLESISAAQTQLSQDIGRQSEPVLKGFLGRVGALFSGASQFEGLSGSLKITIEEVRQLGEALGKGDEFYRNLERAARDSGKISEEALKDLEREIGLRKVDGVLVVDATRVQKELAKAYQDTREASFRNAQQQKDLAAAQTEAALRQLVVQQEIAKADSKLGSNERTATAQVREIQDKVNRKLSESEQVLADQVVKTARSLDQEAEATQKAEKARAEAAQQAEKQRQLREQEAQQRKQLVKVYEDSIDAANREAALVVLSGDARERLALQLDLEAKAKAALGKIDYDQAVIIERTIERLVRAKALAKEREDAEQKAKKAQEDSERADERRVQILDRLNSETALLLSKSPQETRELFIQAEIKERLNRIGKEVNEDTQREIELAVRRNVAAKEYAATVQQLGRIGAEVGDKLGAAFGQAAFATGSFGKALSSALEQLAKAETQALIQQLFRLALQYAGTAIGQSLGLGSNQPVQPGTQQPGANTMNGRVLPNSFGTSFAMGGQILDQFQTINRGGYRATVAEGGPSTPEAVVPLTRDQFGRLAVHATGAGGGTYNMAFPGVQSASEARRIRPTARQMVEQLQRSGARWRGGARGG